MRHHASTLSKGYIFADEVNGPWSLCLSGILQAQLFYVKNTQYKYVANVLPTKLDLS